MILFFELNILRLIMRKEMITIERHFLTEMSKHADMQPNLINLFTDITLASKIIRSQVITAGLGDLLGKAGETNIQGEDVQKLDVFANDCIKNIIGKHGHFAVLGSEEEENVIEPSFKRKGAQYVLLFDPLDGSSNIDVNISVGTIFSIYKVLDGTKTPSEKDCMQPGYEQVAAGYVVYGASVMMVYTAGHGVHGFTYDPAVGEFLLSHENIKIPDTCTYYSINEGNASELKPQSLNFLKYVKGQTDDNQTAISARYVGSLVADFHRNLLKGGIFAYPATDSSPNGKLRLMYEANPLAFICEQAGGAASDGTQRMLDVVPTGLHQRVPLVIGNKDMVERFNKS